MEITNAQRLQRAAQAELNWIRDMRAVGRSREHFASSALSQLVNHARFMDETLPGVTILRPHGCQWQGTAYSALQRVAKATRAPRQPLKRVDLGCNPV